MASSKAYLDFILDQLSSLNGISYKAMRGEYIIYYQEKIIGGIYDDRFLVKPPKSAKRLMPDALFEIPYDGAKANLLVGDVDNRDSLHELLNDMIQGRHRASVGLEKEKILKVHEQQRKEK